jgi:hypothetical protein
MFLFNHEELNKYEFLDLYNTKEGTQHEMVRRFKIKYLPKEKNWGTGVWTVRRDHPAVALDEFPKSNVTQTYFFQAGERKSNLMQIPANTNLRFEFGFTEGYKKTQNRYILEKYSRFN